MTTARHFARISHLLLIILGIGGLWWQAPADAPPMAAVLFSVIYLPLLLFLPATLGQGDARLLTWFCFLLLVYFCGFVMQATEPPPERTLALARIGVLTVLFVSCLWLIRGPRNAHD